MQTVGSINIPVPFEDGVIAVSLIEAFVFNTLVPDFVRRPPKGEIAKRPLLLCFRRRSKSQGGFKAILAVF